VVKPFARWGLTIDRVQHYRQPNREQVSVVFPRPKASDMMIGFS
jgi:hypothetical protein